MSGMEHLKVEDAPTPKATYSQVVRAGDFLFVAGQRPIDPKSQQFQFSDIKAETELTLENVEHALTGCGASRKNIGSRRVPGEVMQKRNYCAS